MGRSPPRSLAGTPLPDADGERMPEPHPVQVSVDYPDRPLNQLTTGLRIFTIIPIAIVLGTVSAETWSWTTANGTTQTVAVGAGGVLVAAPLLMILFRQKYPPQCGIARNRFTSGSQRFRSRRAPDRPGRSLRDGRTAGRPGRCWLPAVGRRGLPRPALGGQRG